MRRIALICTTAALAVAAPASAGMLDMLGQVAAQKAGGALLGKAMKGAAGGMAAGMMAGQAKPAAAPADDAQAEPAPARKVDPTKAGGVLGKPTYTQTLTAGMDHPYPRDLSPQIRNAWSLDLVPEDREARQKFDEAHRAPCATCNGGFSYDIPSIAEIEQRELMPHAQKVGALAAGKSLSFTGKATGSKITITVVKDQKMNQWKCKQAKITATKGAATDEVLALYCLDMLEDLSGGWYEVV